MARWKVTSGTLIVRSSLVSNRILLPSLFTVHPDGTGLKNVVPTRRPRLLQQTAADTVL